jgi:DNA-binding response OmpR family regulator
MKPGDLIVEDERAIWEPAAEHPARAGFDPKVAETGAAASDAFGRRPSDLVLLTAASDGDGRDLRG